MSLRAQLERDLSNRLQERLRLWTTDSIQLYRMAELPYSLAMGEVALALTVELLVLTQVVGMPVESLTEIFAEAAKIVKRLDAQKEESL